MAYILITGCDKNDTPFPKCISADYFGPEPVTVSAYFPIGHNDFFLNSKTKKNINSKINRINYDFYPNQVIKWKNTGLKTNGDDLVVRINGAWASLKDSNKKKSSYSLYKPEQLKYSIKSEKKENDGSLSDSNFICNDYKFFFNKNLSNSSTSKNCKFIDDTNYNSTISHDFPCWFTNGYGAYLLFKRPYDKNPNESLKSINNPESPTIHLGYDSIVEKDGKVLFTLKRGDKTKLKNKNYDLVELERGWEIYVKILDEHYSSNVGGYSLEFLKGVQKSSSFGFFDYIYRYLKCVLLTNKNCEKYFNNNPAAAQTIFQKISEKSTLFHNFILSLLILFIIISSLSYLLGIIQKTKQDILIRTIKIIIITVLISPESFNFFYNYFLIFFIEGLEYIISITTNFISGTDVFNYSAGKVNKEEYIELFGFMENMFSRFFSYSVWKKIAAFLHYQIWTSLLIVPVILIGIILYFFLCLYAYIIFLSGFVGIAFLIAIMPFFLVSILFLHFFNLFEGWIKLSISFCLQSIIMFTLLSLLSSIIMDTFYRQLGFTVCYNKWLEIKICIPKSSFFDDFCIIDNQYFSWTPGQIFVPYTIGKTSQLDIDKNMEKISKEGGAVKFTGGAKYISLPPDYTNKGFRYIDYPFINPTLGDKNNPADHYIAEGDIVVNSNCTKNEKDLVRLTNSLLHASEKSDIISLINNIDKKIDSGDISRIIEKCCQDINECVVSHKEIINKIKNLIESIIVQSESCRLQNFYAINNKYQENNEYQRIQEIQMGKLINVGEVFILFLLSFLMFSLCEFAQQVSSNIANAGFGIYTISSMYFKHFSISAHGNRNASFISKISYLGKSKIQDSIGRRLEFLKNLTTHLPKID